MRHIIVVVGSRAQLQDAAPRIQLRDGESQRVTTWFASRGQDTPWKLLDDAGGLVQKLLLAPLLAYNLYQQVHSVKLWSGKRPLVLVRGRSFASRVAAYAGTWGGGDVVKADHSGEPPLGPTRFVLDKDGNLKPHAH